MPRSVPLNALRVFESVARLGSISAAAYELCLTPSAVSKHINKLESYFDVVLFNRNGPRLYLTGAGEKLSIRIKVPFTEIDLICDEIKSRKNVITMKTPSSFYIRFLADILELCPVPVENVSMWMDAELTDFVREPYTCAIQYGDGIFPSYWESIKLIEERLVPVCAPRILENYHAGNECNIIHPSLDKMDWSRWSSLLPDTIKIKTGKEHVVDTMDLAIRVAQKGLGIALVDELMVRTELKDGQLTKLTDISLSTGASYYFVYPKNTEHGDDVELLVDFIQSSL
ncbi:LysR family transcriptional regulator [Lonsdalea quercina]|uniref:LysR family transcriptional regulator n=1 Tax=Lonsdalea quercina TaxID=71657 RepID=UPI003975C5A1